MAKQTRTEREAALIAAARQELANREIPRSPPAGPPPESQVGAPAPAASVPAPTRVAGTPLPDAPAVQPDVAARIALLMQAEQEEKQRRNRKLQQIGVVIPAMLLVAAILWVASLILRYFLR